MGEIGNFGQPACTAAFSQHPDPAVAVGEVVGGVLESLEAHPDLAVVLSSGPLTEHVNLIADAVDKLLAPEAMIGSTAAAVFGGPHQVGAAGGLALWAARGADLCPIRVTIDSDGRPAGLPDDLSPGSVAMILGHQSFPIDRLAAAAAERQSPSIETGLVGLVGGLAGGRSTGPAPRLIEGDGDRVVVHSDGAVGVLIPAPMAQLLDFEVRVWEDGDPIPEPPVNPATGRGALLFANRRADLATGDSLDLEVVFERFAGTVAGMVGRAFSYSFATAPPCRTDPRTDLSEHSVAALVYG
ncbi:MAG: hypothetical protein ACR2QK_02155 [Acidimicrobiales bacterium]